MTDQTADSGNSKLEENETERGYRPPVARGLSRRTLLLFSGIGLLLLCAVLAISFYTGILAGWSDLRQAGGEAPSKTHYIELEEIAVTLGSGEVAPGSGEKVGLLRLQLSLELGSAADAARIKAVMPRITDSLQAFLRELRTDELQGSHALYRLKEELLARVNAKAHPIKVREVLVKQLLVR